MELLSVTIPDRSRSSMETLCAKASFHQSVRPLSGARLVESLKLGGVWQPNQILSHGCIWEKTTQFQVLKDNTTQGKYAALCFQGYFRGVLRFIFPGRLFLGTVLRMHQGAQLQRWKLSSCTEPEASNPQNPAILWSSTQEPPPTPFPFQLILRGPPRPRAESVQLQGSI